MRQRYVMELPDFSVELVVERDADTRLDRGQAKLVEDMIELALDDLVEQAEEAPEPERAPTTMPPESGPTIPPPGSCWCVTCEALKNICVTVLAPEPGDCVTCGEETRWQVPPARPPVDEALIQVAEQAAREHLRVDPDEDLRTPVSDEEDTCDCTVLPRHGRYVIGVHHARDCRMWHDGSEAALPPEPEGRGSKVIPWAPPEDAPAKAPVPVDEDMPF